MRRHWKRIAGIAVAVLLLVGVLGYLWLTNLADPMPEAEAALVSDDAVTVDTDPWLTFTPAEASSTGLIFYPGGRVPAEAYAPPVRAIAEAGYTSIIPSMPFGLAVLDANAADGIIEAHPEISVPPTTIAVLNHRDLEEMLEVDALVKMVTGGLRPDAFDRPF